MHPKHLQHYTKPTEQITGTTTWKESQVEDITLTSLFWKTIKNQSTTIQQDKAVEAILMMALNLP